MRVRVSRTKYKNPPINELIIGAYFDPPLFQLQAERVGLFWSQVRGEFPVIVQQPEMAMPIVGQSFQINFEPYPMPRFWLIAADDVMLMQIQRNAFLLNWRKREKEYPRFDRVKDQFDRYFGAFRSFMKSELGTDDLPVRVLELTYHNVIQAGEGWTGVSGIDSILPGVSVPKLGMEGLGEPDINYVTAYRLAPDLTMNLTVRTGRHAVETAKIVLIFEYRAIGVVEDWALAEDWYRRAHDVINACFTGTTSDDMRSKYWQPE
jgi:uncharacterized protein (TIGR04255 family)